MLNEIEREFAECLQWVSLQPFCHIRNQPERLSTPYLY